MTAIKLNLLKVKQIKDDKVWLLSEGNLYEYLNSLKTEFYEYAIQRKIVKNDYLDKLFKTVLDNEPFPIITLTTERTDNFNVGEVIEFDSDKVEILDGLQRTFRLWAHLKLYEHYSGSTNQNKVKEFISEFKQTPEGALFFELGIFRTSYIKYLIESKNINEIKDKFENYTVYFYVWLNLSEIEVVNKMLLLNLGQKSVSPKHQFELLFLHFYRHFVSGSSNITIVRERELESKTLKGEHRQVGSFLFSSIIIAMLSFYETKAKRVNKSELGFEINEESDLNAPLFQILFEKDFIENFLKCLYRIDEAIDKSYSGIGIKWFGKDTTLSGVYAGISEYVKVTEILKPISENKEAAYDVSEIREKLKVATTKGVDEFILLINQNALELEDFEKAYENLSSRSINIGNVLRSAIKGFVGNLLNNNNPKWSNYIK
ncbi:MAG: hypothetical protein IM572_11295 [Chitinophagaceae bacterium]|nr:hypothetical protein [Chitinophagaceae bacterium]